MRTCALDTLSGQVNNAQLMQSKPHFNGQTTRLVAPTRYASHRNLASFKEVHKRVTKREWEKGEEPYSFACQVEASTWLAMQECKYVCVAMGATGPGLIGNRCLSCSCYGVLPGLLQLLRLLLALLKWCQVYCHSKCVERSLLAWR